ncbi:MAG: hypothetical protein AAB477_02880 [Patescibacteria group bacterium]
MTKIGKTLVFIVVVLLVIGSYFYFKKGTEVTDQPKPIEVASIVGCYVAKLGNDVYSLKIDSEVSGVVSGALSYNNYQKDSSSGPFNGTFNNDILLADYSFYSEGMLSNSQVVFKKSGDSFIQGFGSVEVVNNKNIFKDVTSVTYDPKSTFIKSPSCIEHFSIKDVLAFNYNSFFVAREGDKTLTQDWRVNSTSKGLILAKVTVPIGYIPQTNFIGANFIIGRSTDPAIIKTCTNTIGIINEENKGGEVDKVMVNGYPFIKFTTSDAGAGNFYETTSYRGLLDGDCYALEYTIHSTNVENYSPEQGIKAFDELKIQNELEKIVKSFRFLVSSD